jgi:hypothetical protein
MAANARNEWPPAVPGGEALATVTHHVDHGMTWRVDQPRRMEAAGCARVALMKDVTSMP